MLIIPRIPSAIACEQFPRADLIQFLPVTHCRRQSFFLFGQARSMGAKHLPQLVP